MPPATTELAHRAGDVRHRTGTTEVVKVVPDVSLMTKIGRTGYNLPEILAEFIDNSIDASPGRVTIDIGVDAKRVTISDNARGMNKKQFIDALTLATSEKKLALGEYGLGMKQAAVSLGNRFEIQTTPVGREATYGVERSRQAWNDAGKWQFQIDVKPARKTPGTVITVSDLTVPVTGRIGSLRTELGRRFAPFIRNKTCELLVNGVRCQAPTVELLDTRELGIENPSKFSVKTAKQTISGWVGLMVNSSQKGAYGFDTFRRDRLITHHDKMAFQPHPTVARIVGEVHMDAVPVTTDKREWMKTDPLYQDAEEALAEIIKPYLQASKKLATRAVTLKAVEMKRLDAYKEGLLDAFDSVDLKQYTLPERQLGVAGNGRAMLQPVTGQHATAAERSTSHEPAPKDDEPTPPKPRSTEPSEKRHLRVKGKTFDYDHRFGDLGENGPQMDYEWDDKKRNLTVVTNQESPAFEATRDVAFLAFTHVVDAVSQVIMHETGGAWTQYDDVRQVLTREASKHVAEMRG